MKNVALLGFGRAGKKFYEKSKTNKKIFISHILKKKLIKFKDKKIKIFNKIEPVIKNKKIKGYIIATPVNSHFQYAKKIVKIKKPFIIEKPIVANPEELKARIEEGFRFLAYSVDERMLDVSCRTGINIRDHI